MVKLSNLCLFLAGVFVLNSCKIQPTTPAGMATIQGRVVLAPNYFQYIPPFSGVTVALEGTDFFAVTDDSGYYTIPNVPTGTYNVHFSKTGYGDVRLFSITITGGGNAPFFVNSNEYPTKLFKVSNIVIKLRTAGILDTTLLTGEHDIYIVARGDIIPDSALSQFGDPVAIFFSHSSNVSSAVGHYSTYTWAGENGMDSWGIYSIDTGNNTFLMGITPNLLRSANFNSGDSIYIAAYGAPLYEPPAGDYYDPAIQQNVLSSVNPTPSAVVGIKMP